MSKLIDIYIIMYLYRYTHLYVTAALVLNVVFTFLIYSTWIILKTVSILSYECICDILNIFETFWVIFLILKVIVNKNESQLVELVAGAVHNWEPIIYSFHPRVLYSKCKNLCNVLCIYIYIYIYIYTQCIIYI